MGLSSSQARLLTLTARMHQIEYKAAKLEAQKLQMANESRQVYEEYLNAIDMTKVQMKTINNTGAISYIDATYNNLIAAGYKIDIIGDFAFPISAKLLKPITQVTAPADIPAGYTAIYTAEDLQNIGNNPSGNYILMNDIDLSGVDWTPLMFEGTFDGNGHVIKNLRPHYIAGAYAGLFGYANNAKISNLGIEDAEIHAPCAAVLVANSCDSSTEITNCYVTGNLDGYENAGIAAYGTSNLQLKDCYVDVYMSPYSSGDYIAQRLNNANNCYYVNTNSNASSSQTPIGSACGTEITRDALNSMVVSSDYDPNYDFKNSTEWLTNMINAGAIVISKPDNKGNFFETSVATDTGLQEVSDETLLRKAEAKYEADMRKIDAKDRKYDMDLAAIDNERNAIKSEMETLKTVAKDNVERTFKLFS